MSWTQDLIVFLEASELGLVYGQNLFKGPKAKLPNTDGPFVSIIRATGLGTEGTHNSVDVPAYERPVGQVVVRAKDYDVAEAMAESVYAVLWPVMNQFVNGTWWKQLNIRAEPADLPPDEQGRPRLMFLMDITKRTSPETS